MDKLDQSLLDHAAAVGTKESKLEISDAYLLKSLAETHYYLKRLHEFKPDEVADLLQFIDPLEAARECWENRNPDKEFSIRVLLCQTKAHEQFLLVDPADYIHKAIDTIQTLDALLDKNMADFDAEYAGFDKDEIAEIEEVTNTREVYDFIRNTYEVYEGGFEPYTAELMLHMENPLKFLVDTYPSYNLLEDAVNYLTAEKTGREVFTQSSRDTSDAHDTKPFILEQIKTSQQPAPEVTRQLFARLDKSLLTHTQKLGAMDNLQIEDVYLLRNLAGTHNYLKNAHQLDSMEAKTLSRFTDPLVVANHCREGNTHEGQFPVCELLQETSAWNLFDLVKPKMQKPHSLLEQLNAAIKAVKEVGKPTMERPKSAETR